MRLVEKFGFPENQVNVSLKQILNTTTAQAANADYAKEQKELITKIRQSSFPKFRPESDLRFAAYDRPPAVCQVFFDSSATSSARQVETPAGSSPQFPSTVPAAVIPRPTNDDNDLELILKNVPKRWSRSGYYSRVVDRTTGDAPSSTSPAAVNLAPAAADIDDNQQGKPLLSPADSAASNRPDEGEIQRRQQLARGLFGAQSSP